MFSDLFRIFELQYKIQELIIEDLESMDTETLLLLQTHALMHETIEVEMELNWKHWKKPKPVDWEKVKNEIVDQFIFLINECNAIGMSSDELLERTLSKQEINVNRQLSGY